MYINDAESMEINKNRKRRSKLNQGKNYLNKGGTDVSDDVTVFNVCSNN